MNGKKNKTGTLFETLPVQLPPSLASHAELYTTDPGKALARLKQHLRRRGNDPVGYMLLALMYKLQGEEQNALLNAQKARIFAPGSMFMKKLPYFLSHPGIFKAWTQREKETVPFKPADQNDFLKNIDNLIDILSDAEPRKIRLSGDDVPGEDHVEATNKMAVGIATETLASIYEMQGNTEKAIDTYKRIAAREPSRAKFCDQQIRRLNESDGDEPTHP